MPTQKISTTNNNQQTTINKQQSTDNYFAFLPDYRLKNRCILKLENLILSSSHRFIVYLTYFILVLELDEYISPILYWFWSSMNLHYVTIFTTLRFSLRFDFHYAPISSFQSGLFLFVKSAPYL